MRKKQSSQAKLFLTSQNDLIARIQTKVDAWVRSDYTEAPFSISDTTRTLIDYWFGEWQEREDKSLTWKSVHRMADGSFFGWFNHQVRAVLTVIYLYEACGVRRLADLSNVIGVEVGDQRDPWPKLGLQMATGSGKTKVMSLLAAWALLNEKLEGPRLGFGPVTLIIAPNLIVLERLLEDFAPTDPGKLNIFRVDPIIPRQFDRVWDLRVIHPNDVPGELVPGQSTLILSNIQKLTVQSERQEGKVSGDGAEEAQGDLFENLFGAEVSSNLDVGASRLWDLIVSAPSLFVLNDEAHHIHDEEEHARAKLKDEELAWHRTLEKAHASSPLTLQSDFSATLFEERTGRAFRHQVYNYTLREARNENVVKRAKLARLEVKAADGFTDYIIPRIDTSASNAWDKYKLMLQAGIAEWKKAQGEIDTRGLQRKALLFIVCEDARKEAPEITQALDNFIDDNGDVPFKGKVLEIHIGRKELTNEEAWQKIKDEVKKVDATDNPYTAVVSVMMLKEGWDVRNVKIIVPLRPCASRTLTEQLLGRGLRKMFPPPRDEEGNVVLRPEELIVIEHESFAAIINEISDIVDTAEPGTLPEQPPEIRVNPVQPEEERERRDILIPYLLGAFETREDWPDRIPRPLPSLSKRLKYTDNIPQLIGLTTHQDIFDPLAAPEPGVMWNIQEARYIAFDNVLREQARRLLNDLRLSRGYETEVKALLKAFYRRCVFDLPAGATLDFDGRFDEDPEGQRLLILNLQRPEVWEAAREAVDSLIRQARTGGEAEQVEVDVRRAKDLPGFDTRYPEDESLCYSNPKKCVFDKCCFESPEERLLAGLLDDTQDVAAWLYNDRRGVRFFMQYIFQNKPAYYYPDFIVRLHDGSYWLVEPKGRVTAKDIAKKRRGERYCEIVSRKRGEPWQYLFVVQNPGIGRNDLGWWKNTMPKLFSKLAEHVANAASLEVGLFEASSEQR